MQKKSSISVPVIIFPNKLRGEAEKNKKFTVGWNANILRANSLAFSDVAESSLTSALSLRWSNLGTCQAPTRVKGSFIQLQHNKHLLRASSSPAISCPIFGRSRCSSPLSIGIKNGLIWSTRTRINWIVIEETRNQAGSSNSSLGPTVIKKRIFVRLKPSNFDLTSLVLLTQMPNKQTHLVDLGLLLFDQNNHFA